MSDVYEDEMAAERALLDRMEAIECQQEQDELTGPKPSSKGGRPSKVDPVKLVAWRQAHSATVAETAKRWNVSEATVKRLSREYGDAAKAERKRWQCERLDEELRQHEYGYRMMFLSQRNKHIGWVDLQWFTACEEARGTPTEAATEAAREAAIERADREFRAEWERRMGPVPFDEAPW